MASGTGAVGHMSPEWLSYDAHERHHRQDPAEVNTGQTGIFFQIKAKVGEKNSHRPHVYEPKEGERNQKPHGPILASLGIAISLRSDILFTSGMLKSFRLSLRSKRLLEISH